ncbi:MAG: GNAT family N-acetyltransferase [Alphaproteobacteria bacterium]|nr:GNAT family N-acetyltransferase [Alphaproteobacteria bacterium]
MAPIIVIADAVTAADIAAAKALSLEYAQSLGFSLCFQGFDRELATFPAMYAPPAGALVLARVDGEAAGAVGLRPLGDAGDRTCEMKRLYVRPSFRGLGLGRALAQAIVARGSRLGYRRMKLDTLASMQAAHALYEALGFVSCAPYDDNPIPGARYLERALVPSVVGHPA